MTTSELLARIVDPLPPEVLEAVGQRLTGQPRNWQTPLAGLLHVTPQAVRHWKGGARLCTGPVVVAMAALVKVRELEEELKRWRVFE